MMISLSCNGLHGMVSANCIDGRSVPSSRRPCAMETQRSCLRRERRYVGGDNKAIESIGGSLAGPLGLRLARQGSGALNPASRSVCPRGYWSGGPVPNADLHELTSGDWFPHRRFPLFL